MSKVTTTVVAMGISASMGQSCANENHSISKKGEKEITDESIKEAIVLRRTKTYDQQQKGV